MLLTFFNDFLSPLSLTRLKHENVYIIYGWSFHSQLTTFHFRYFVRKKLYIKKNQKKQQLIAKLGPGEKVRERLH